MMQNPDRFAQSWYSLLRRLTTPARRAQKWLLPAAILALALGIGTPFQSAVVQAQDGGTGSGQQATVTYLMRASLGDNNILCVGLTKNVSVVIERQIALPDFTTDPGTIRTRGVALATFFDGNILSERPRSRQVAADSVIQQDLEFIGLAPGTTSIDISATVFASRVDVALPISQSTYLQASVSVRVVHCEYEVTIKSDWNLTIHGARARMNAYFGSIQLLRTTETSFKSPDDSLRRMDWATAVNRIRGCPAGSTNNVDLVPPITAEIEGDKIYLTVNYRGLTLNEKYYRDSCRVPPEADCRKHPDGVCYAWPGTDRMEPVPLERISFSLTGGTQSVTHNLRYVEGSSLGTGILIIGSAKVTLKPAVYVPQLRP